MGPRRKARELTLQMLFQSDLGQQSAEQVRKTFWMERQDIEDEIRGFANDLFGYAKEHAEHVDELIERHAEHWRVDRMSAVDRNILRSGVAELLAYPSTPAAVVINEALEIARKFSAPESVHFINGVLDSTAKDVGKKAASS